MTPGDLPQAGAELVLGFRTWSGRAALGRTVLSSDTTGPAFGYPEALDEHAHRSPATLRGHHFPDASSFNIASSGSASARSFFSRAFSFSSS
jgi:hypothetical protein